MTHKDRKQKRDLLIFLGVVMMEKTERLLLGL
jgi:hypothetical protein